MDLFTLRSSGGLNAQITNYGGRVVNLFVPDQLGGLGNVVLGFNSLDGYLNAKERFYGATIGRYGNRIAKGQFALGGASYFLETNDGENHLHGGVQGFDRVVWDAEQPDEQSLLLRYESAHMEEGYPGTVTVTVTYCLRDQALEINYEATSDVVTVINLTHHSYFNLAGAGSGPISDHVLTIMADSYTAVGKDLIPTGEIASVEDTPMDFRTPTPIGSRIDRAFEQLTFGGGYDHNWVLRPDNGEIRVVAVVQEPTTGRVMEVATNEPGLQFYSGNFFDGSDIGSSGKPHQFRHAFALETQHFPDSPNKPHFPATVLRPGEVYRSFCSYGFSH